ncbi:XRE family transcriptional regulator [[Bacillus] caldolyticus]|uniref:XRE family transcriptional regulator n=1 Tax=Bacillus caldolyticus TaxID=1394 RepID=A0ABN5FTQ9_BACCL|nr:helix-turn-helix transcriptional regulator [[Bacillus] caldolyticus]AUI36109.1 XRE family transcriptional regulator [[Bacillus] caldolyticus]
MFILNNPYDEGLWIENIEEFFKERDYFLVESKVKENNLQLLIRQVGISVSDLQKITGISKQNLNEIIYGESNPSIDKALKIAYVLNYPVEKLFPLKPEDWYHYATDEEGKTLYFNTIDGKIYNTTGKKLAIKNGKYEYYDNVEKRYVTKKEYKQIVSNLQKSELQTRYDGLKQDEKYKGISANRLRRIAKIQLQSDIDKRFKKVYIPIGKRFTPYYFPKRGDYVIE